MWRRMKALAGAARGGVRHSGARGRWAMRIGCAVHPPPTRSSRAPPTKTWLPALHLGHHGLPKGVELTHRNFLSAMNEGMSSGRSTARA